MPKFRNIRTLKHIISAIIWTVIGLLLIVFILLRLPAVQEFLGQKVANALSEQLGTEVSVGKVDIGLLSSRITIDDVLVRDQRQKPMLSAARLSANMDFFSLFDGKVSVNSAQIFGLKGAFYQENAESRPNYAFVLDSLSNKDKESSPLDISIKSLIIRNAALSFNRLDLPPTHQFDTNHLSITDFSGHLMLHRLTDNELSLDVKKMTFKEASGLNVKSLEFDLHSNQHGTTMNHLSLSMPQSTLHLSDIKLNYCFGEKDIDLSSLTYQGNVEANSIYPPEWACFLPRLASYPSSLSLHAKVDGHDKEIMVHGLALKSNDNSFSLNADATLANLSENPSWALDIHQFVLPSNEVEKWTTLIDNPQILDVLRQAGSVTLSGMANGEGSNVQMACKVSSDLGGANLEIHKKGQSFSAKVDTDALRLDPLLGNDFGMLEAHLSMDGSWPLSPQSTVKLKGTVPHLAYKGKDFRDIVVDGRYNNGAYDGTFVMASPDGDVHFDGLIHFMQPLSGNFTAHVQHFNPHALGLTDKWQGYSVDCDIVADVALLTPSTLQGALSINNLVLSSPENQHRLDQLSISSQGKGNVSLVTDFCEAEVRGTTDLTALPDAFFSVIADKLPTLPGLLGKNPQNRGSHVSLSARVEDSDWIRQIVKVPLTLHQPMNVEMELDEPSHSMDMTLDIPDFTYSESRFEKVSVDMTTVDDTLKCTASLRKLTDNSNDIDVGIKAMAVNNMLHSDVDIDTHGGKRSIRGFLSASTQLFRSDDGAPTAHAVIHNSRLFLGDEEWRIQPADILYSRNGLLIDNLALTNHGQHLIVNGRIRPHSNDTLSVDVNRVDLEYLSSMMGVKNVSFGGIATGRFYAYSLYDDPSAHGTLKVDDFSFVDGQMGNLSTSLNWKKSTNKLNIGAIIDNGPDSKTFVDGHIGFSPSELNLNFNTQGTPLAFIEHYCPFMKDVQARSTGWVRVIGSFKEPDLEGLAVVNGPITMKNLNVTYTLKDDTIALKPGSLTFDSDTVYDKNGHQAVISGIVNHKKLGPFTTDIHIHADNALVYDFPTMGSNNFCGTVYATGDCHVKSRSGEVNIDVEATPEANTLFVYNASSPDAISNQSFIQWNDITPRADTMLVARDVIPQETTEEKKPNMPSNLHMNILVNANTNATLRVLMNEENGDLIDLLGNGILRMSYFNKGAFNIFGNYVVDHGVYKMTIQNILSKDFQFQEGGTITFGGNPFQSNLDLKAVYTVNGVSLSDLNIGRNFATNNIRVNCIMNIGGTVESPTVDFDMEMPTVNADAQQMVRSLVDSEEELNQQVIYLLTIGRFYSPSSNNAMEESTQSQTSLAMQSLLSGTISQQINNVLSSVLNNNQWNFGANISTGDEGWNNAEYEGTLSGRLMNNRLLINGQFGYRDNSNATSSFIGDFDVRYLLFPSGNLAVRVYNQTNDRYFTKNSLNTQGVGLIMKKDFNGWRDLFGIKKKKKTKKETNDKQDP
ncbi:MAG: translocation/assembly module TamB domain-containing protein [Prevotella sp.]|nr:translocation/assembly module TamB domain-containing protein [Prevotella sp.]